MDFFKTEADIKAGKTVKDRAEYVKRGGSLRIFKPADIIELQDYALNIKDVDLYDYLQKFWKAV